MVDRPWPLSFRSSSWGDPLDDVMAKLMPAYNSGARRSDIEAVRRLLRSTLPARSARHVTVVGTNGKTSTATYLARLLTSAGQRTGLFTSPHLRSWTERIRVDLEQVPSNVFADAVLAVHAIAARATALERPGDLRFFDILTIAAEEIFGGAGAGVGVFEAGIGGRLDATRCLDAELVLLTGVGDDHESLLGARPHERLREKALAARPGSTLVSVPLGRALEAELLAVAAAGDFHVELLDADADGDGEGDADSADRAAPRLQRSNLRLARAGMAQLLPGVLPPTISSNIDGRLQSGIAAGVPYIVDVGHNPTAWCAFLDGLPHRPHVVVVAISVPRPVDELVRVLSAVSHKLASVTVTTTTVRPAQAPAAIVDDLVRAGVETQGVEQPDAAFAAALQAARARGLPLAVFGSTFVAVDFLAWLRRC
ncbi:MAG: dihydrofolate synthase / folylpolyglutamate synthase [Solirubrobacteraceae bacterium]|jgi:dihydrofolate synthase/folylpolyglutamate synthase|nr:dihydrofolate synthase / folylpolyglutamate synthase [Solirubrobacteraceae bacterium]